MDSVDDHPDGWGFPIRKSSDQSVLATPRSLSQPATSFIASQCQGIRQTPLLCLISRFVSEMATSRSPYRLVPCRGRPPHQTALIYPFLPLCLGDRARNIRLFKRPHLLPINDVKERTLRRHTALLFYAMVEADGIEPTTSCLQSRRSPN